MEKITLETAKTGSELVLETLRDLGIDTIFGYPGGAVLPLYDAIYSFEVSSISWVVMNKDACMRLKATLNQLESWVSQSSLVDRGLQMPLQGLQMP